MINPHLPPTQPFDTITFTRYFRTRTILSSFVVLCLVFVFLFPSSGEAQDIQRYRVRATVQDCVHVRSDHTTSAPIQACLSPGTLVSVLESVPYWRHIRYGDDQIGWAAKKFLEPLPSDESGESVSVPPIPPDAWLEVHFVDVGQGDAMWIHTHDDNLDGNGRFEGYNIVIDGGPYSADGTNPLLPYLEDRGHHGAVIDALILTHPHNDHYNGAETISRHFHIRDYYDPGFNRGGTSYPAFLAALQGANGNSPRAEHLHVGREHFGSLNWGEEVQVDVLYSWVTNPWILPSGETVPLGSGNTIVNNASIVLRLQYGQHRFLFMGDAEGKDREDDPGTSKYIEKILLETYPPEDLHSTVLKVAHHGSETSSTWPFIRAVDPDIVVVQSGRKNFHGVFLPDWTALERYCCHNPHTRIYRTDQNDAEDGLTQSMAADGDHIIIHSNGKELRVESFEGGNSFTVNQCPIACTLQ